MSMHIRGFGIVFALAVLSFARARADTVLDGFGDGSFSMTATSGSPDQGINLSGLSTTEVLGGRRRAFVRYLSGTGSILLSATTSGGGRLDYVAGAGVVGEQVSLGYGSNIGASPVPMNANVGGATHFLIDVIFASHAIPLEMFFTSGVGGIPVGGSFLDASLPASASAYTAAFDLSTFLPDLSKPLTNFADLDGATITFGKGPAVLPAGISFAIGGLRFGTLASTAAPVPEPGTAVLAVAGLLLATRRRRDARRRRALPEA